MSWKSCQAICSPLFPLLVVVAIATCTVVAGATAEKQRELVAGPPITLSGNALDGLAVRALTPDIARGLGLQPGAKGVVVVRLPSNAGSAESAGLKRGDVIEEVDSIVVVHAMDFIEGVVRAASKGQVLLLVNHRGRRCYIVIAKQSN